MSSIKIYSTTTCVYCKMAKDFFQKHNVKYEEYDVAENEKARAEMLEKSQQLGVPVIDIDGKIIIGFSEPELKKALNIK